MCGALFLGRARDVNIDKGDCMYEYDYDNRITKIINPGRTTVAEYMCKEVWDRN